MTFAMKAMQLKRGRVDDKIVLYDFKSQNKEKVTVALAPHFLNLPRTIQLSQSYPHESDNDKISIRVRGASSKVET